MKKILLLVLVFTLVSVAAPLSASACASCEDNGYEKLNIVINGVETVIPDDYGAAMMIDNRTMVPVRFVSEQFGFSSVWRAEQQMVTLLSRTDMTHIIVFQIGGANLFTGSDMVVMDVPAMMIDNRSYISLRFLSEAAGFRVEWNEDTRTVSLYK